MLKEALTMVYAAINPAIKQKSSDKIEILPEDVFLASYPKSGNTWVRFVLGNIYNGLEKKIEEVNFHTVHELIPELGQKNITQYEKLPRVLKTHETNRKDFRNIILILRNPIDVLYSYCKYLNGEKGIKAELTDLIRDPEKGIRAIVNHANSHINSSARLVIILYENMLEEPKSNIGKICDFLNIEVPDEVMTSAIEKSSFESMRKLELLRGRKYGNNNFLFTRSGEAGEGERNMNQEDLRFVMKEMKKSPVLFLLYGKVSF